MPEQYDYKKAGLDLEKYEQTISGIQVHVARTQRPGVIPPPFPPRKGGKGVGGFASLFDLSAAGRYTNPVLVTCTDGVGSKLKIAQLVGKFDTVGIDLVAMSVNDLICTGGEPLSFLDYLAMPKDDPALTAELVKGIADGCLESGCALVGGETAILPDFYAPGDFDLAGFAAGVVERDQLIDGRKIQSGDAVIGLASSGVHSNGYSLVRKVAFEAAGLTVADRVPELGKTVGEELLTPTRLYVKPVRRVLGAFGDAVHGLANITGGGLPDNVGRILPPDKRVHIARSAWSVPPVFGWLQKCGNVADAEMFRVFNMGVGFVVICAPAAADGIVQQLAADGVPAWHIGAVQDGAVGVEMH
ncbi:Phosphoribosylformylglycinamidine cyclo-ligase [Gemmata obscuriglobus]|uniref:Phosphoribosylformylglycinamidine cyclo-ligase n=1 Tax=Gemmata obscuriglobus TaxID=114 RepID=A0A2Z3H4A3_9BACT|nr:phosphoribosylformylglycinamidine cyclo-ligase [Gemmata obscuriglobus]AWM40598.1 phosphoribosylformylglycinamidine cyclo-ligase [Gemmata obscuriglobus]QEG26141.1 Phosphoribosylformylglycinamidine cyclo-ligase [Gemmata obscuriglobus]VTS00706.1 phosphoribosylaminoimidazole synthetase : Phosphoribosylformylglycinamidine cyclo-ligase OS=Pirellula staleyi (strain ATCC 27377 / DSM 6068 / ICPB 4128) GN=purM PE=3 SV=1: AIRS: AIRS_C [Gemmata obscuriglobus UQM 2246]